MMASASARGLALTALEEWRHGQRFADSILQQLLARSALGEADRGFATELFYGMLRNLTLLDFWINRLRSGSLDHRSRDLLRLGLYQIFLLRTATHAAVFETVQLAPRSSRSLVNGVLRSASRRIDELSAAAEAESLSVRTSQPQFIVDRWTAAFGVANTDALCAWDNQPAPIYARVNTLKTTVESFLAADSTRELLTGRRNFVRVGGVPLEEIGRGECYIQDPGTSVACALLDPQPGDVVLDACAAPGGKTGLLADMMRNRGRLFACDREPARLDLLSSNLQRLGAAVAEVVQQDWTSGQLAAELQGKIFDRILLDAPCTNTGVIRRRVDLRWRLKREDFARMANEQITIAREVIPLLKPGGVLVYSTCSLEADENEGVVERLLREFPALVLSEQHSVLPFRDGYDGAYAAKLIRTA